MTIIEKGFNPQTFGVYAFFEHKGSEFYADLCDTYEQGNECMIFRSLNKQVTSWSELYCKRGIPVNEESLLSCIQEFIESLN